jgi:hypothetical protein
MDDPVNSWPYEKPTKVNKNNLPKTITRNLITLIHCYKTMRRVLLCAAVGTLTVVGLGAQSAPPKKAPAKGGASTPLAHSTVAKKPVSTRPATNSHTAASSSSRPAAGRTTSTVVKTASSHGVRKAPPARTTWRARQTSPAPERYKEIQEALVSKGYLSPDAANGAWNPESTEALKRFQGEQNLDSSGKINSLSLIALGLGPKHEAPPSTSQLVPVQDLPVSRQ